MEYLSWILRWRDEPIVLPAAPQSSVLERFVCSHKIRDLLH
jgi:hypothetical protein